MYIFISHSSKDAETAQKLCEFMEQNGIDCFLAPRDIRAGYEYAAEIVEGVDRSDGVLLILSEASNRSPHVLREVERAVTRSIPILVYKIEEVTLSKSMEYFLMTHQWMNSGQNSYEDILKNIEKLKKGSEKPIQQNPVQETTFSEPKKNNKKKLWAAVAVIAAVAVLAVGISIGVFSKNHKNSEIEVELGDTVTFGTYNNAAIDWRVLQISEDQTEAILVSDKVLTVKAYDAPESGKFNYNGNEDYYAVDSLAETDLELQAFVRGDNSWETSNIRTWLNSSEENVQYEGQAPESAAMADRTNGYNAEPGFLCGFTEEELEAIKETTLETKENALSDQDMVVTQDKVFLLSMEELEWFKEANVSLLAEPTPEAVKKDNATWYRDYCLGFGIENHMWWLREPVEGSSSQCYLVGNGYQAENIYMWEAGVESFGIRPAITVDLTSDCIKTETP